MARPLTRWMAVLLFLVPAVAKAQGLLVVTAPDVEVRLPRPIIIWPTPRPTPTPRPRPIPESSYKIKDLEINARLVDQIAQVQVSQTFVNTGSRQMEVSFVFPLPYDGAIDEMTLLIDGKEYSANLLEKDEARRLYEQIVRKNKDPALLEWMGTGLFRTSVFPVPAGASRTVSLRYSQMCRKMEGLTDFLFPLSTAKYTSDAVERVSIRATIESQDEIKNVYSPTHPIEIKRPDNKHATITYTSENEVPTSDFRLMYDVGRDQVSTKVLSYRPDPDEDGYFLLLASPRIEAPAERPKKTVVFVIDRSGSMSGKKIEQVRDALKDVLNKLREGDLFNIVAYDSAIETFRPELQRFDEDTRKAALGFVEGLYAGGSTNIDGALRTTLAQLQDEKRPSYVLFLTDGLPTAGETNEMKIAANAKDENKIRARLFTFGVGYDVNSRLLDRLVRDNFGLSEYVRPDEDIEDRIGRVYERIESPVMSDVKIEVALDDLRTEEGRAVNRVYPSGTFDLFATEQLVVVGRYKKAGAAKVTVRGMVGDKQQSFDFPAELVEKSRDETNGFVEKLWAVRRVGEILSELDLKGKNSELIEELVKLSTRHGIITPYTSFMADENTNLRDVAGNVRRADERLGALSTTDGVSGFNQRALSGQLARSAQASRGQAAGLPSADAAAEIFGGGAMGGMGGGMGGMAAGGAGGRGGRGGMTAGRSPILAYEAREEAEAVPQNVRNIGNRTFFQRDGQWVDSLVTETQEANATRVKQFSDEYFALAERHGRMLSQYLVFDEPVLLNIDDRAYLIEP